MEKDELKKHLESIRVELIEVRLKGQEMRMMDGRVASVATSKQARVSKAPTGRHSRVRFPNVMMQVNKGAASFIDI